MADTFQSPVHSGVNWHKDVTKADWTECGWVWIWHISLSYFWRSVLGSRWQKHLHCWTTYHMHFFHHDPPHHNDTASDGEHTPFSSLDTTPVCLTVTSLLLCCIKTVISFCIFLYTDYFCTLFIGLHFVMPLINKIKWMKNAMLKAVHHLYMCL